MNFDLIRKKVTEKAIRGQLVPQYEGEHFAPNGPYEIPNTWRWVRLADIATNIEYGTSVKCHENCDITDVPVLRMGNIKNGKLEFENLKFATKSLIDLPKLYLNNGDIVFNRTNSRELVGKCAVFSGIDGEFSFASYIIRARVKNHQPTFIAEYINSDLCRSTQILPFVTQQVGQANFNGTKLKNILIPLPPVEEQKRIVAKLEKAFAEIHRAEKAYQELQTLSDALTKQILQKAIEGKLVPQLDSEGVVEQVGDVPEEVPFEIPTTWKWVRIENCVQFNPKVTEEDDKETSFVPMTDVEPGFVSEYTGSQIKLWKSIKKGFSRFNDGDVLLAKITPCFQNRKSCVITNLKNSVGAGSTEFHVLRVNNCLNANFLLWFLKSEYFIKYGVEHFGGTVGQQRVGTADVKQCYIPLPPIEEQKRIVTKIEELFKQVEALKA